MHNLSNRHTQLDQLIDRLKQLVKRLFCVEVAQGANAVVTR